MDNVDVKVLKEVLKKVKQQNREEKVFIFNHFFKSFLNSIIVYGIKSDITKDAISIWKEFKKILKEEQNIHRFVIEYSEKIDFDDCLKFLDSIDELNEKTLLYYYKCFEDILCACETKCDFRAKHNKKNFDTLLEADEYQNKAVELMLTFEDIKNYFNYEEEFWQFVDKKIKYIDGSIEKNKLFYGTLMKFDENENLIDIKVIVPNITNLETALVNIHEFKHAYDLYQMMGKKIENEQEYEKQANLEETNFSKQYIKNIFNK